MAMAAATITELPCHASAAAAPTLARRALLQLMWLASPALPVGGFSYSEGLEAAVEAGHVDGEAAGRALAAATSCS